LIIRNLDANHDWTFGQGQQNYLTGQSAIAENINTRLLSFINDCYFDLQTGVDWFRLLGSHSTQQEITLSCRAIILASYGVLRVNSINATFNDEQRNIILTYNIDTIFTRFFLQQLEVINA
jgi:hypothetical protein